MGSYARNRFFRLALASAFSVVMVLVAAQSAHAALDRKTLVKTAIIVKMAVLVTWPDAKRPGPGKPLILCILGNTALPLNKLEGQRVKGQWRIQVREISKASGARKCHMLFISDTEAPQVRQSLDDIGGAGVLTFSDMGAFVKMGGMVGIVTTGEKVGFELNIDALKRAGLKIDVGLYKLAQAIVLHGKVRRRR